MVLLVLRTRPLGSNGTVNRLKVQGGGSEKRSFSRTAHLATPETYEAADSGTNNWFDESRFSFFHPGELPELQSHLHDACIFKGNQLKSVGCSVAPRTPDSAHVDSTGRFSADHRLLAALLLGW